MEEVKKISVEDFLKDFRDAEFNKAIYIDEKGEFIYSDNFIIKIKYLGLDMDELNKVIEEGKYNISKKNGWNLEFEKEVKNIIIHPENCFIETKYLYEKDEKTTVKCFLYKRDYYGVHDWYYKYCLSRDAEGIFLFFGKELTHSLISVTNLKRDFIIIFNKIEV